MKTKITTVSKAILALVLLIVCTAVNAQIKYDSNGWLTIGNTTRFGTYNPTILSNGIYIKGPGSNFFQVDVTQQQLVWQAIMIKWYSSIHRQVHSTASK